eukprot:gene41602-59251_t
MIYVDRLCAATGILYSLERQFLRDLGFDLCVDGDAMANYLDAFNLAPQGRPTYSQWRKDGVTASAPVHVCVSSKAAVSPKAASSC